MVNVETERTDVMRSDLRNASGRMAEGRVAGTKAGPLLGDKYMTAKALRIGEDWRAPGCVLSDADLAGRSIEVMLKAGDIVAVPEPEPAPKGGRKR